MAPSPPPTFGFSSPTFSWSSYSQYRPTYPSSLYNLIFDYHCNHGNASFSSAHDIGSGAGIVASVLAQHFQTLHVSDPSSHNLDNAKQNLRSYIENETNADAKTPKCRITFSQTPAEQAGVLPDKSVDMATIFIALHWTNAEKAIAAAAASLKKGGTLVLLHYSPRLYIPNNSRAMTAWNGIMDAHSRNIHETPGDLGGGRRAHPQTDSGLDYVELLPDMFEKGVKRLYINTEGRGEMPFAKSVTALREGWFPVLESRVGEQDVVEKWQDEEDWGRMVDGEWFRGYFETIQPTPDVTKLEEQFRELRETVDAEGGKTRVLWSVAIVLATRK